MLAVVPIFVSAGAAVLPTIIAAAASVVAIVLRPRELAGVCRRRPLAAALSLGAVAALSVVLWVITSPAQAARQLLPDSTRRINWSSVAEDLILRQRAGFAPTPLAQVEGVNTGLNAVPAALDAPVPSTDGAVAIPAARRTDFSRTHWDGSAAPAKLAQLWSYRPEDTMFLSRPAIDGSRLYVAGCQSDLGGYTGLLACLDFQTGKAHWEVTSLGDDFLLPFFSSPAVSEDGKSLLIGQGLHADKDCSLLCFDTSSGQLRWRIPTPLHIESSPAIRGDLVVVGAGAIESKDGRPSGDPGFVLAASISQGRELWRQAVVDPESSPAIGDDGMVFIGSGFNGLAIVALRSEPEEELRSRQLNRIAWSTPVGLPVTGAITLAGDLVIAGAGNGDFVSSRSNAQGVVVALDRKTGQVRWRTAVEDSVLGTIAHLKGVLICPSRTGEVLALSATDGRILWRTRISGRAPVLAGCAFTGDYVYAASSDGYLAALSGSDGALIEKLPLNDQARPGSGLTACPPQVVAGRLIVGSETGGIRSYLGAGAPR